jgi:pantoate--beta-alanine ligase
VHHLTVVDKIPGFRAALDVARADGHLVGFVPTMGYLHDGHVSLIEQAAAECDVVAVSIFVNPLLFGAGEDLAAYPRDLDRDIGLCAGAGADWVFAPSVEEMYPDGTPMATTVSVAGVSETLEGVSRPTHFAGVATVVAKLFALAGICRAYFGEKDWQQLAVIRRMAADLSFPVEVVGCPTVREPDGLAMSSRNAYLTAQERAAAPALHRALLAGVTAVDAGERSAAAVRTAMRAVLVPVAEADIDYLEVVDAATLAPVDPLAGTLRLLGAARFGKARLIDNVGADAPPVVDFDAITLVPAKPATEGDRQGGVHPEGIADRCVVA